MVNILSDLNLDIKCINGMLDLTKIYSIQKEYFNLLNIYSKTFGVYKGVDCLFICNKCVSVIPWAVYYMIFSMFNIYVKILF